MGNVESCASCRGRQASNPIDSAFIHAIPLKASRVPQSVPVHEQSILPMLWNAIRRDDVALLKQHQDTLQSLKEQSFGTSGRTMLLHAVSAGKRDAVAWLLALGADLDARDNAGCTVFHIAAGRDDLGMMDLLVTAAHPLQGERVARASINGQTPLHYCASTNCSEVARKLISAMKHGTLRVERWADHEGRTPSQVAKDHGYLLLRTYLEAAQAELSIPFECRQRGHVAARNQHPCYPPRQRVPNEMLPWTVSWPGYTPPEFTDPSVIANDRTIKEDGWADPEDPEMLTAQERDAQVSYEGALRYGPFDYLGGSVPLNPKGRTGLARRGLLGQWGPNHAVDAIITRMHPEHGQAQVLSSFREAEGVWGLPGCMRTHTATRSLMEAGLGLKFPDDIRERLDVGVTKISHKLFSSLIAVAKSRRDQATRLFEFLDELALLLLSGRYRYRGYVDDWRNSKILSVACCPMPCRLQYLF